MEKKQHKDIGSPMHVVRCLGELATMYLLEKMNRLDEFVDAATDVWGEDEAQR